MPIIDYDFKPLLDLDIDDLLSELAIVHGELANIHEEIAMTKVSEEPRKPSGQRIQDEGHRDALIEKKFLILRLLDARSAR